MKDADIDTFLNLIWRRNIDTQIAEARRELNKKRFVGRKWYDQKAVNEARRKHQLLLNLKDLGPDWDMVLDDLEEKEIAKTINVASKEDETPAEEIKITSNDATTTAEVKVENREDEDIKKEKS